MIMAASVQPRQPPAIEQAAQIYAQHGLVLARDLEAYLRDPFAYVIKNPELILLARPILKDRPTEWITEAGACDAWYVHLLVGRPGHALREMPYTLPWCCWHRDFRTPGGRLHVAPTDTIIKKLLRT